MDVSNLLQGVGWLTCLVLIGLIAALALVARAIAGQRGQPMEPHNSAVQSLGAPPFEDSDLGGIPTTGPVQDFERDAPQERIVGSSGFVGQQFQDELEEEE
ncbi:MAG: hypothetical protein EHM21_08955 [Chloroflexi bacterium]|nr:MAG: hypothetical protein EHM21_08955 [Chloroflexota bacterium]